LKSIVIKAKSLKDTFLPEGCFLAENYRSDKISIARATVKPGVTTAPHHLVDVDEIYIIVEGTAIVHLGNQKPAEVESGDVVFIAAGTSQSITNMGNCDLVFFCVCNPCFTEGCYINEKA
jgi:mannose-6-phosphate isomerase-like protein (cupin superfamily)